MTFLYMSNVYSLSLGDKITSPACCKLQGKWFIQLISDQDDREKNKNKVKREIKVSGYITFNEKIIFKSFNFSTNSMVKEEKGLYSIPLSIFEPYYTKKYNYVSGYIYNNNNVYIKIIPREDDFGFSLEGKISKDIIKGIWNADSYEPQLFGQFIMMKVEGKSK